MGWLKNKHLDSAYFLGIEIIIYFQVKVTKNLNAIMADGRFFRGE